MADDLARKLRDYCGWLVDEHGVHLPEMREAADEIEALRTRAEAAEATLHDTQERLKMAEAALKLIAKGEAEVAFGNGAIEETALVSMDAEEMSEIAAEALLPEVKDGGARE